MRARVEALLSTLDSETRIEGMVGAAAAGALESSLPVIGGHLGPYQITGIMGRGGMGIVYKALRADDAYNKEVAIKMALSGTLTSDLRQRFLHERQILANLDHPNIARLMDGGTTPEGIPYVVMEFVAGKPIDVWCDEAALGKRERVKLIVEVSRAVEYAHRHLVVHRDLKPDNIYITSEGIPKLLDFGIAKALDPAAAGLNPALTIDTDRLMTPGYASPEQIRGEAITTGTDVYQLGVLLYVLLTGKKPFEITTQSMTQMEKMICETLPPKPNLDDDLDRIILQALEKEPSRRYASAGDLADDLERYLQGFPVAARASSFGYHARKFVLRHKLAASSTVLVFLLLLGFSIAMVVQARRLERERNSAQKVSEFLGTIFIAEDKTANLTGGKTLTARELLDRGAVNIDRERNLDPVVKDRLLQTLGHAYLSQGIYGRARDLYTQSLHIRRSLYGERSHEVAETMATMVDLDFFVEDYAQAKADSNEWLAVLNSLPNRKPAEALQAVRTLAQVQGVNNDLKGSLATAWRAVDVAEKLYGKESYEAYDQYNPLGNALGSVGDYAEEEKIYRKELVYLDHGRWQENPNVVLMMECMSKLGWVLAREGRYAEAEKMQRDVVMMRIKILGHPHDSTAAVESTYGFILGKLGKMQEAETVGKQAMVDRAAHVGTKAFHYGTDEGLLAQTYAEEGKYSLAEPLIEDQIALCKMHYGFESLALARSLNDLGRMQTAAGQLDAASATLQTALAMEQKLNGDASPYAAVDHTAIGNLLMAENKLPEAEVSLRRVVAIAETPIGQAARPVEAESLESLGAALLREGRKHEAEPLLAKGAGLWREMLPAGTPQVRQAESLLAQSQR
ncbi:MAG TPA: serine/threonine-protein kinase [Acidobacteriaceae bacterium]|nr:serine/threonine-protein kinase [Acidobacteriaceae bacterium]